MKNDAGYLEDMVNDIGRCQSFLQSITRTDFDGSHLHKYAVAKAMENIGEAASKLTLEFRTANPDLDWSRLTRTRNQLIHNYGIMDPDALWEAAKVTLPELANKLSKIMTPPDNDDVGTPGSNSGPGAGQPDRGPPTSTNTSGQKSSSPSSNGRTPKKARRKNEWER